MGGRDTWWKVLEGAWVVGMHGLESVTDFPITLQEVIYVPNLQANLLLLGRMTNVLVDMKFSGDYTPLLKNNHPLAYGSNIHNIFAFNAVSTPEVAHLAMNAPSTIGANLWHQRMCHTNYNTLETMSRQQIVEGLNDTINYKDAPICSHCPFGKHARLSFKYTEPLSLNIGDLIVSDVCGPFDTSMGGYKYFITWIDARTRYTSIDFLKDKQCSTITSSFNNYLKWLQNQKGRNKGY